VTGICVEGIITSIHSVEVDIAVEQDIEPQSIGEVRAVQPDDEVVLGASSINDIISFESEGMCDVWIEDAGHNVDVSPGK